MFSGKPAREDPDLERLYAQARRYDLLSHEQERQIDGRKWAAVRTLLYLMIGDPFAKRYLNRWTINCLAPLPDIEQFKIREHRSLLRRELADYLPGGSEADQLTALVAAFDSGASNKQLLDKLLALALPASLVVGLAEAVSRPGFKLRASKVAVALEAWERHWQPKETDVVGPAPTTVESLALQIKRYTAARDQLVKHNLRLVYTIAGRNRNKGVGFLDLVQEGNLGLLRAAEKFQFERGYRFSTYAFNWITQGIRRHLADAAGAIRYPSHIQEQLGKVYGERGNRLARSGVVPRDTELAAAVGLSVDKTRQLLQFRNLAVSLEAPRFQEDEDSTLLDSLPGGPFAAPRDGAEQASLNRRLLSEIDRLDPAEQQVVIQRWGLLRDRPLTRAEVADQMAVSREWVRQLEQSALDKLAQSDVINTVYSDYYPAPGSQERH